MPTKREREYYRMGFRDGKRFGEEYSDYPAEEGIERFVGEGEWARGVLENQNPSVNYPPGISLLKQIAESHALDIRMES